MSPLSKTPGHPPVTGLAMQLLIAALGLLAGYLIYSQWLSANLSPPPPPPVSANDSLAKFKDKSSFDFDFFNNRVFKSLKLLGEAPVVPGPTGKVDPFAP